MKTTPFTEKHISLGAKMHEFAGYNMPIEYSGIIDEHLTVCQGVGVFDVSHMGEFWVKGPHALDFLQKVTSNNIAALTPGKVQVAPLVVPQAALNKAATPARSAPELLAAVRSQAALRKAATGLNKALA